MGIALKHLSESERIRIARELFQVTKTDESKGELHGRCPIHKDAHPSFSYNYRTDLYHCFSCGADGDLCGLWSAVRSYSKEEGFRAFCEQYGIAGVAPGPEKASPAPSAKTEGHRITPDELDDVWKKFPPLPEARIRELAEKRRWTPKAVKTLDLRLQTHYFDAKKSAVREIREPDRIAIPVRDSSGRLQNIRLYRPGGGQNKIISWARSTGSARLFPAAPLESSGPVLICEGEPDTICAVSQGFTAITQTSKTKTWSKEHLEPLKGRDVIICYDADAAGQQYALYAALNLLEAAASVRILSWPDKMGRTDGIWPEDHGQDLTDFFAKHQGKAADLQELMKAAPVIARPLQRGVMDELIALMGFPAEGKYAVDRVKEDFWTYAARTGQTDKVKPEDLPGPLRFFERGVNDRLSFKPRVLADHILKEMSLMADPSTGLIYKWNGRIWEVYEEEHIGNACIRLLGKESQKGRIEDAVYQVRRLCTLPHNRTMNDQVDWICVENGMLNLRTKELREHDRDFLATFMLPVSYEENDEKECTRFLGFLEDNIQTYAVIMQIQEFAGYCLTPSTAFEKCLLLLGPGADGKSVFLKLLRELVGAENCSAVSFPDLEDQFQRSSLYGKLLNISTEVGGRAIESPYFKAITSGDPLNAAFKHRNAFEFCPTCKLAFAANRLPRVLDNSDGYFRRLMPIQFKRQYIDDYDPDLFETLKGELSEIFVWAVEGLQRLWKQRGFTKCDETERLLLDYRRVNNPVLAFVEDRCTLGEEFEASKRDIYQEYRSYCGESGYQMMNIENFFRELYAAYQYLKQYRPRVNGERSTYIKGIKVDVNKL
jgi:putative DNA primase/helicase